MNAVKDVNDLYQRDPAGFEAAMMARIRRAVPAAEYVQGGDAAPVGIERGPGEAPSRFDAARDRVSLDELLAPPEPRRFIVDGRLPQDAGTKVGPGGGCKSTNALWEGIHIILGKPLYGREILTPGGIIVVSGEDERRKSLWRLSKLVDAMALTHGEKERVAESLYIPDISGTRVRLVEDDGRGNLTFTTVIDELIDAYSGAGISHVVFDPLVYFGPGERWMNDGGAEVMFAGRRLAHTLGCCVEFVSHTSMATARGKVDDQYSARGAASISDNGRFTRNLWTFAESDRDRFGDPPSRVTAADVARKRVFVLTQPKLSDGPPVTENTWLLRDDGWGFTHLPSELRDPDQITRDDVNRVQDFLRAEEQRDCWHTKKTLEDSYQKIGLTRVRLRRAMGMAEANGWIVPVEIPTGHHFRKGGRTHRFSAGVAP